MHARFGLFQNLKTCEFKIVIYLLFCSRVAVVARRNCAGPLCNLISCNDQTINLQIHEYDNINDVSRPWNHVAFFSIRHTSKSDIFKTCTEERVTTPKNVCTGGYKTWTFDINLPSSSLIQIRCHRWKILRRAHSL